MLATLTMRPKPASSMSGSAARLHRNVPIRLTSSIRRNSSSEVRTNGADSAAPALLTRIADRAKGARGFGECRADGGFVGHVAADRLRDRQRFGLFLQLRLVAAHQRDLAPCGCERRRDRRADAAAAAGHHRMPSVQRACHRGAHTAIARSAARLRLRTYCSRPDRYCTGQAIWS